MYDSHVARLASSTKTAESELCASLLSLVSRRKFAVIAIRATERRVDSDTWSFVATSAYEMDPGGSGISARTLK